jgi:hypothetical protein
MSKQTKEIEEHLTTLKVSKYKIDMFKSPKLEDKYGEINLLKVALNDDGMDLLLIPGYGINSYKTMLTKIYEGMKFIKNKYRNIYMINWGEKVKALSKSISEGLQGDEKYNKEDEFKEEVAKILDKLIRSSDMNLRNFTVLGKSAGGGIAFFLAGINSEVKVLMACCPGIHNNGTVVANRLDLKIYLMRNDDDNEIPLNKHEKLIIQLQNQGNNITRYNYKDGGHELNVKFLEDTQ